MAKVPRTIIAARLAEQTLGNFDSRKFSGQIAAYLLEQGRVTELEPLMRDIMQYRADHGIVEVQVVSARPLTEKIHADVERQVKTLLPNTQKIILAEQVDESLIGGVRLVFPNEQLDLSIRAKLNHFKQLTVGKD